MRYLPLIVFFLAVILATAGFARGQVLGEVFNVDTSYTKSIPAGEEEMFIWLVYNRDASDVLLTTQATPVSAMDWSARVAPSFLVLNPGDSTNVTLTVSTLQEATRRSVPFTVTFSFARAADPLVTQSVTRNATVNIEAAPPPVPTENLILGIFPNPLPPPFDSRAVTFLINIALWGLIAGAILLVVTPVVRRVARRTKTELDEVVLHIVRGPIVVLIVAYGFIQSVAVLEPPLDLLALLFLIYNAILIVTLTWLAYRLFHGVLIEFGRKAAETRDASALGALLPVLNQIGAIIIVIIGVASLAALFGYDLTAFLLGAGVVGIAIAFAAQDSLSNFFSGILLMLDRPFKEGDLVEIDGDRARVEKIGIRSTILYHRPSHKLLVIPNSKMAGDVIVNLVQPDLAIRQRTSVGVEYGADVETVKEILANAAKENPWVIKDEPGREPYARLEEFGDSAMIFKMKFWVSDADKLNRVRGQVNETIVARLTEAGIDIPAPKVTVTMEQEEDKTS